MCKINVISRGEREESVKKSEPDLINKLPDEILSCILSHITVREALDAKLLSTRWRHLRPFMYNLNFDWNSMFPRHEGWYPGCGHRFDSYRDRFVGGVNQFLQHHMHKGSHLVSFRVSFYLDRDSSSDIDKWVSSAVSMGVRRLELIFSCTRYYFFEKRFRTMNLYTLTSEPFSQISVSKLQHLFLRTCILGQGVINQFNCLKSLILVDVLLDPLGAESIFSSCLKLESVTLARCDLPHKLFISGSSHSLKFLSILDCWRLRHVELSAPKLTIFEYAGTMIKSSFSRVPNLEKVFFRTHLLNGVQQIFSQLAKDFPLVKTISIHTKHRWVKCVPEHTITFDNVKNLEIYTMPGSFKKFDTPKMISILKACPLLEKLYLVNFSVMQGIQEHIDCVHKHLKEVHFSGYFDSDFIEFVKNVLEYAATLELVVIDPKGKYYYGGDHWMNFRKTWAEGEREAICARLQDYYGRLMIIIN